MSANGSQIPQAVQNKKPFWSVSEMARQLFGPRIEALDLKSGDRRAARAALCGAARHDSHHEHTSRFRGTGIYSRGAGKIACGAPRVGSRALKVDIEIDGGVKLDNIAEVKAAGANVFVSGSGIFGHGDYRKVVKEMRDLIAHAPVTA